MTEIKENVELNINDKQKFKVIAATQNKTMKDLLLQETKEIIQNNEKIPIKNREEEENRTSLIINIPTEFKKEIKEFTEKKGIKIRDLWVESVNRILRRYNNV